MAHIRSFQADAEIDARIEEIAEELETSKSAAIRYLIKKGHQSVNTETAY